MRTDWWFKLLSTIGLSRLNVVASRNPPNLAQPFDGNYEPIIEYLSAFIKREMKLEEITGLSIALVDHQQMIWSEGFGLANKALNVPATNKTRYRLASVSKLFNAVAIMQEVERGNLDLDAPVVKYVPGFRINSRFGPTDNITLRNLLTHHSGLPEDLIVGKWARERFPLDSIVESLSVAYTAYPANKIRAYSNIGVSLSGLALQLQSGKQYQDYMHEHLLQPLQMSDSDFSGMLEGSDATVSYENGNVVEQFELRDLPAGGLISTVDDMANFAIAMLGEGRYGEEKLLNSDSMDEMLRVQNAEVPLDMDVPSGLGWSRNLDKLAGKYEVVGHDGSSLADSSKFSLVPELGMGVIVLSNNADHYNSNGRIVDAALKQLSSARGIQTNHLPSITKASQEIDAEEILPGDYVGLQGIFRMSLKKKTLHVYLSNTKKSFILGKNSNNWYAPRYKFKGMPLPLVDDARVTRSTIDGKELLIVMEDGRLEMLGERVLPQSESEPWSSRLGYYKSCNPDEIPRFRIDGVSLQFGDGYYLIVFFRQKVAINQRVVQPISDTELVELGLGRGIANTIAYSESSGKPRLSVISRTFEFEASSSDNLSPLAGPLCLETTGVGALEGDVVIDRTGA